jgi:hypothetical protein
MGIFTRDKKPSQVLDNGWQFCSKPTEFDKPGTVFRIDRDQVRYEVTELPIAMREGIEVFGNSVQSRNLSVGIMSRIFGITGADIKLDLNFNKDYELKFSMDDVVHEQTTDVELDKVIPEYKKTINYRADNKYYLIREAKRCSGMTYFLTDDLALHLGGDVSIEKGLSFNGNLFKMDKGNGYQLAGKFPKQLRVMFLVEEIKPNSKNLIGNDFTLGRKPVEHPLLWKDSELIV